MNRHAILKKYPTLLQFKKTIDDAAVSKLLHHGVEDPTISYYELSFTYLF